MRGAAPVTPDPKMHMKLIGQKIGGATHWFENDLR